MGRLRCFAFFVFAVGVAFAREDGDALVKLLNSRSAQSPRVYEESVREVRKAADAGGVLQRYVIALIAEDVHAPTAAKLSPAQRKAWLEDTRARIKALAEQRDNSLAWYLLSLETNDMKALERAAEGGNVQALNAWGTILVTQATVPNARKSDTAKAALTKGFNCFRSAAIKQDANGIYNLGMCYMQGLGCDVNIQRAFQCFHVAAEGGHPEAINNIGGFYRDGVLVATNAEVSVKWFKKSAELGNPYGQLNYALALQRGDGVSRDLKESVKYLKRASDQDCAEAQNVLGMAYYGGRGVKQDFEQAFRHFRRSAEAGFVPAMDNLAICYERGDGTPRDVLKSAVWKMRFRAANGDADARAWVERQEKEGVIATPVEEK